MLSREQVDERGHDLAHREPGQGVFVAHHQQLAHLDDGLELLPFVAGRLQAGQQLGGFRCGCERGFIYLNLFLQDNKQLRNSA